jgi:hypothetical protein
MNESARQLAMKDMEGDGAEATEMRELVAACCIETALDPLLPSEFRWLMSSWPHVLPLQATVTTIDCC